MYATTGVFSDRDCEGCEYNLLNEDCDILKKFKRIQLEYHHGYNKLINNSDYIMVKFNKEYIKLYGVNEGNGDILA